MKLPRLIHANSCDFPTQSNSHTHILLQFLPHFYLLNKILSPSLSYLSLSDLSCYNLSFIAIMLHRVFVIFLLETITFKKPLENI